MIPCDAHGQPLNPFPAALLQNYGKAADQLIGIARGIICDGDVSDAEAAAFRKFVDYFFTTEPVFPFNVLKERLDRIFRDGRVDDDERAELRAILRSLGGIIEASGGELANVSCSFPLDEPAPSVVFENNEFVVTGRFAYGTRAKIHAAIESLGGIPHDNVRQATRYLVIGHFASRDWLHTSYGLKIQRATELRDEGHRIAIISEAHWRLYLT